MIVSDHHKDINNEIKRLSNMRQACVTQQRKVLRSLDKIIVIPILPEDRVRPEEDSIEFRTNQWTLVNQATNDVMDHVKKKELGAGSVLAIPVDWEGFQAIKWYMRSGAEVETIAVSVWRIMIIIYGHLEVIVGPETIMKQLNRRSQLYAGYKLFIAPGERIRYRVEHNVVAVTRFFADDTDPALREYQASIQ